MTTARRKPSSRNPLSLSGALWWMTMTWLTGAAINIWGEAAIAVVIPAVLAYLVYEARPSIDDSPEPVCDE